MRSTFLTVRPVVYLLLGALVMLAAVSSAEAAKKKPKPKPKPKPDLVVSALEDGPALAPKGTSITTRLTVRNGSGAVAAAHTVQLFLSADAVRGAGDVLLGSARLRALKVRDSLHATIGWTMPGDIADGSYLLLACADAARKVAESDERNNCRATRSASVVDSTAPAPPLVTMVAGAGPSNVADIPLVGAGEPGSTIAIHRGLGCAGGVVSTFAVPATGIWGAAVTAVPNDVTRLSATARDASGNRSVCGDSPSTYVHDSVASAAPTVATPSSPSNNDAPRLTGTADPGAVLRLFAAADCTGAAIRTFAPSEDGTWSSQQQVAVDGGTTSFSARSTDTAGNASPCSASASYTYDSGAPDAPVIVHPKFAGPHPGTDVRMDLDVPGAVRVEAWANATCDGVADSVNTDAVLNKEIHVTIADSDTPTPVSLRSYAANGTPSPCTSTSFWREWSWTPSQSSMSFSTPTPTNVVPTGMPYPTVMLYGSALPGAIVRVATNFSCSTMANPSSEITVGSSGRWSMPLVMYVTPPHDSDYSPAHVNEFWICGRHVFGIFGEKRRFTYQVDLVKPVRPGHLQVPASGTSRYPEVQVDYVDSNSRSDEPVTINLFATSDCSGPVVARKLDEPVPFTMVPDAAHPANELGPTWYSFSATDHVGNESDCNVTTSAYTHVE